MSARQTHHEGLVAAAILAVLALTAGLFHAALGGPFLFDDFPNLQNLRQIDSSFSEESIRRYLASFNGNPARPLATLTFLIEDSTWPAYPADFKRNNLLLHLIIGLLLFSLARALATRLIPSAHAANWMALACATAWLVHPIQLSATMLVVQRMNMLSTMFIVLGLLAYLRALSLSRWPELARVIAAGAALVAGGALAFLSKENGVLIFAYATTLNFTLLTHSNYQLHPHYRRLLTWGAALPLVLLTGAAIIHLDTIQSIYRIRDFTMTERLLTESRALIDYLRIILLPRIGGLSVLHDDYAVSRGILTPPTTLVAVISIAALIASALALRQRAPVYSFAVLWYFAGHLIESTIYPLELYFEHRNYLPMVGPLFAVAYWAFMAPLERKRLTLALLSLWIALCAALTGINAHTWGDRGRLATVWWLESPKSLRAAQMVASHYSDQGDYSLARQALNTGIQRLPEKKELVFQRALLDCVNLGMTPTHWRELGTAAAALKEPGSIPEVFAALVSQDLGAKCQGTLQRNELKLLARELMVNPRIANDAHVMAYLHYELARLALDERNLDSVMRHMDAAYEFRKSPFVPREQAIYLLTAGLPGEALTYLDKSDATPLPLVKRLLLDMPERNRSLRESAISMMRAQESQPLPRVGENREAPNK